jgi:predicted porin
MHHRQAAAAFALAAVAGACAAQSNVTLYGNIDEYGNYMKSSSGTHVVALEDGAFLRSRFGFKGQEDIGDGWLVKFTLETGFNTDSGGFAGNSIFDRQSWVGIATPSVGEFRVGRQNGPIFVRGAYIDYTTRTLGSVVNDFGVPSRYDNDVSFISARFAGVQAEAHVSLPETAAGNHPLVYQFGVDWQDDDFVVGYAGLRGRPPANPEIDRDVVYDNVFADWRWSRGTVYLAYVHSNNNTSTSVSNNAGQILGNTGGYNDGTNADLNHFYDIWQVSADWRPVPLLRVGALWGRIEDTSGRDRGATGASLGAYYDLSKRTTLLALVNWLRNDASGGFRFVGSGGLKSNFTNPDDVNGRTITGLGIGAIHRF